MATQFVVNFAFADAETVPEISGATIFVAANSAYDARKLAEQMVAGRIIVKCEVKHLIEHLSKDSDA